MASRMETYWEVSKKIDELEEKGYLNRGDSSVSYLTKNKRLIARFFNDDLATDTIAHLRDKLEEYLTEKGMIFQIYKIYLIIIPDFRIANIINEAVSYDEMKIKLAELPFIRIIHHWSDNSVKIAFVSENMKFRLNADALKPVLSDWVSVYNYYPEDDTLIIKSDKCKKENEIANIDKLF